MFDAEDVFNGLIRGALGGRRKHSKHARHAIGAGSIVNAKTLLAAAGVAWGLYETWQHQQASGGQVAAAPTAAPGQPGVSTRASASPAAARTTPPALPGSAHLPSAPPEDSGLPPSLLQLLRLMISAARADGEIGPVERERILTEAREVGAEADVRRELDVKRSAAEIVAGVNDAELRGQLYSLAFTIVRADEAVTGGERIYLAQLAHLLELDASEASRIEVEVSAGIDSGRPTGA